MRIAMLTYSVKPRGGVVHALEVSEALARRGHEVELMALARAGRGRCSGAPRVPLHLVRHVPPDAPFDERIQAMLEAYTEGLRPLLATAATTSSTRRTACRPTPRWRCATRASIDHVIRTVHHVDDFTSPSLVECQDRSIVAPDHVLCVSQPWVERLEQEFGVPAGLVANGVDARRFRPAARRAPSARRDRGGSRAWATASRS